MASCRWGARSADAGLEEGMGTYLATRETLQGIPILPMAPVASSQFLEKFCFSITLGKLWAVIEANRSKMVEETKIGFVGHAQVSSYPLSRASLASGQVSWSTLLSREQNSCCCCMTWRRCPGAALVGLLLPTSLQKRGHPQEGCPQIGSSSCAALWPGLPLG